MYGCTRSGPGSPARGSSTARGDGSAGASYARGAGNRKPTTFGGEHLSEQRVVLVTGGGTGIGAATARLLRTAGHQVVISRRRPEPLRRVTEETGACSNALAVSNWP